MAFALVLPTIGSVEGEGAVVLRSIPWFDQLLTIACSQKKGILVACNVNLDCRYTLCPPGAQATVGEAGHKL